MSPSALTLEQRRLLLDLTVVVVTFNGKWSIGPGPLSATFAGEGVELVFRETAEEDWVFWVGWDDAHQGEARKLASAVRKFMAVRTKRRWVIGRKHPNKWYVKKK